MYLIGMILIASARVLIKFVFKMRSFFTRRCFIRRTIFVPTKMVRRKERGVEKEKKIGRRAGGFPRRPFLLALHSRLQPSATRAEQHFARRKALVYVRLEELIRKISKKNRRRGSKEKYYRRALTKSREFRSSHHRFE